MEKYEYRMSGSGSCSRFTSATRLNREVEKAPDWLEEIAEESSRHEAWVVEDLKKRGLTVAVCDTCPICAAKGLIRHGIHVELERPFYKLVGHMDGIIIEDANLHGGKPLMHPLEVKGLSRFRYSAWLKHGWEGFPTFAAQVTCYMNAAEACSPPLVLVAKNRDTGQKNEVMVDEPPMDIEEIFEKYDWIESNARAGTQVSCDQDSASPIAKYCRCLDCPHRK